MKYYITSKGKKDIQKSFLRRESNAIVWRKHPDPRLTVHTTVLEYVTGTDVLKTLRQGGLSATDIARKLDLHTNVDKEGLTKALRKMLRAGFVSQH